MPASLLITKGRDMATNTTMERVLAQEYPYALRHLQQLLMDAERCEQTFGKRGFFGGDKFKPSSAKFQETLARCFVALQADGHIKHHGTAEESINAMSRAISLLHVAYSSWPDAFSFWEKYEANYRLNWGIPPRR